MTVSAAQADLFGGELAVHPRVVMTAHYGHNDGLIASVARLYVPDGAAVVDTTYGNGGFWKRTDTSRFWLAGLDLLPMPGVIARSDFRALPLSAESADVVVLDPPYVHVTSKNARQIHDSYRNNKTPSGTVYGDTIELYRAGMTEALRVLRPRGTCWVKCQDIVNAKKQHWVGIELHNLAVDLGYTAQDMFVLVVPSPPGAGTAARQYHARRNHSYLWIFQKRAKNLPAGAGVTPPVTRAPCATASTPWPGKGDNRPAGQS